jgi:RNA-directed DNA polymerase
MGIPSLDENSVSTKLARIAERSRNMRGKALTSLSHVVDMAWMQEAYRRTRKDGAVGVDAQTAAEFEMNLDANLQRLLDHLKSGTYRAPPVRRVYIPKPGTTKLRPLGIPTFSDKVLQMVVKMLLDAVYEQDFLDCSYGFRPGRNQHQALDRIWEELKWDGGWIVEIDFQSFFDTLDHAHLRSFLDQRIRDGVVRRVIDKWLNAGVMEEGKLWYPDAGSPQGGVISPILANSYLHHVLDLWFENDVKPRMRAAATLVRFADDAVFVFKDEHDAKRVLDVLPKRCARYGLTLHPAKTKLVRFTRPSKFPRGVDPTPGTFDFLGLTHYWGRSRQGGWVHKRKTMKNRLQRACVAVWQYCREHRHEPVPQQAKTIRRKLLGHYNYYGVTGNYRSLAKLYRRVIEAWRYWLSRRGQRKKMPWPRYHHLLERYPLPKPRVTRSIFRNAANAFA